MKLRVYPPAVDALQRIVMERDAERFGDVMANLAGEVKSLMMPSARCRDYCPSTHVPDERAEEISSSIGKQIHILRRLDFREWDAGLRPPEMGEEVGVADTM